MKSKIFPLQYRDKSYFNSEDLFFFDNNLETLVSSKATLENKQWWFGNYKAVSVKCFNSREFEGTKESCSECSNETGGCPFSFFSERSNIIQNFGCLPEPLDIVNMRVVHGKTWACHSNPSKPCLGALEYLKKHNLPFEVVDSELITENHDWGKYCRTDEIRQTKYGLFVRTTD